MRGLSLSPAFCLILSERRLPGIVYVVDTTLTIVVIIPHGVLLRLRTCVV